jgi:hypothetical protein
MADGDVRDKMAVRDMSRALGARYALTAKAARWRTEARLER